VHACLEPKEGVGMDALALCLHECSAPPRLELVPKELVLEAAAVQEGRVARPAIELAPSVRIHTVNGVELGVAARLLLLGGDDCARSVGAASTVARSCAGGMGGRAARSGQRCMPRSAVDALALLAVPIGCGGASAAGAVGVRWVGVLVIIMKTIMNIDIERIDMAVAWVRERTVKAT
jgi:hypothetical protein